MVAVLGREGTVRCSWTPLAKKNCSPPDFPFTNAGVRAHLLSQNPVTLGMLVYRKMELLAQQTLPWIRRHAFPIKASADQRRLRTPRMVGRYNATLG